jgi:hypothetical protein
MALVSSLLIDIGVHEMLLTVDSDTITADTWSTLFAARLLVIFLTAVQTYAAWKSWTLLNPELPPVYHSWFGVAGGVMVSVLGLTIGYITYASTYLPEYANVPPIWHVAALWAGLWCLIAAAGAWYAARSYQIMRGRA